MSKKQIALILIVATLLNGGAYYMSNKIDITEYPSNINPNFGMCFSILALLSICIDIFILGSFGAWLWEKLR